ncbi:helix-turn-helix domain-containing protein [Actinokineospora guangxiensis]|uniref:Helix-turn-helix domain-containing protein n=1 Tax=Actinokineospora guangxiensis TaxID=1490288 RepID=A0ABW0ESZ4_9PSEU
MAGSFGALLRELRIAAGISMGQLAKRVNYSKSYLSKIENDVKPPNELLARLCDGTLDAGGRLIESARAARDRAPTLDRRQVLAAGTALGVVLAGGPRPVPDERVITGMRTMFEHLRALAAQTSPAYVLDPLIAHVRTVHALAAENPEPTRGRLLLLAARVAEHTGWMHQEAGDDHGALWWTRHAADLARSGGDREAVAYTLVREAGLAMHRHDPISTVELARRAQQVDRASPRTRAMAARREAQGHALAGDRAAHDRAMDHALTLIDAAPPDLRDYPILGSTAPNPVELARGFSLCDLGLVAESAAVLDRELTRVPASSRRTLARFGARRSLAHALAGEIDQSCATLPETLDHAAQVDSATIRADLRDLSRTLGRWRAHPAVREVYPELAHVLHKRSG